MGIYIFKENKKLCKMYQKTILVQNILILVNLRYKIPFQINEIHIKNMHLHNWNVKLFCKSDYIIIINFESKEAKSILKNK